MGFLNERRMGRLTIRTPDSAAPWHAAPWHVARDIALAAVNVYSTHQHVIYHLLEAHALTERTLTAAAAAPP